LFRVSKVPLSVAASVFLHGVCVTPVMPAFAWRRHDLTRKPAAENQPKRH
jgi:hypothetical protein